jgi:hypothetical protein
MRELNDLLDHIPVLTEAYGRWPSFFYLLLATVVTRRGALMLGTYVLVQLIAR